jgi:hypothetical protein
MAAEMTAAASKTRTIAPVNCRASIRHAGGGGRSTISFGPADANRAAASASVRPRSRSVWSACATDSADRAHHGSESVVSVEGIRSHRATEGSIHTESKVPSISARRPWGRTMRRSTMQV